MVKGQNTCLVGYNVANYEGLPGGTGRFIVPRVAMIEKLHWAVLHLIFCFDCWELIFILHLIKLLCF